MVAPVFGLAESAGRETLGNVTKTLRDVTLSSFLVILQTLRYKK
jgi:hypothetical protein